MEDLKKDVIGNIRACLISRKGKVALSLLDGDFASIVGYRIPYAKLGFNSLENFIKSEPSLTLTKTKDGTTFVDATANEKSAHISDLIRKQKTKKKPQKSIRRPPNRYNAAPRMITRLQPNQHKPVAQKQPTYNHNNVTVPSKIVIPTTSSLNNIFNTNGNSNIVSNADKVLSSNRQRITKKMSALSLGEAKVANPKLTRANSQPNNTQFPPISPLERNQPLIRPQMIKPQIINPQHASASVRATERIKTNLTPMEELEAFVKSHKLGNVVKSFKLINTKSVPFFFSCKITIDEHSFQSYPNEFKSEKEAEDYCAKNALKELTNKYGKRKSLLISSERDVFERIPKMIENHVHGIWAWQLETDYIEKYSETLPSDWLKVIDSSPNIQIEKLAGSHIIRYGTKEVKNRASPSLTSSTCIIPTAFISKSDKNESIQAVITCVLSASEIWCKQYIKEENEKYNKIMKVMDGFYNASSLNYSAEKITLGGFYVTKLDDKWHRIKVVEQSQDESVICFFVDTGETYPIDRKDVYMLRAEFAAVQAQAFVCKLVGLEDLYEISEASDEIQKLQGADVYIVPTSTATEEDVAIPVIMYDTMSGESINDQLIEMLIIESATPVFEKGIIPEVYVSHISDEGEIFVQLRTTGYFKLQKMLEDWEVDLKNDPNTNLLKLPRKDNSNNKLYFFYHKADGHYYRIQFTDWSPDEKLAQIELVDIGSRSIITICKEIFYDIEDLDLLMNIIPFQATKVNPGLEVIPENFATLAKKQMPPDQPFLLKVTDFDESGTPIGEFFKVTPNEGMFCINKSIQFEAEIKDNPVVKITKNKTPKNFPSGGKLKQPEIPEISQVIKVYISLAVNPYNFFVQPLDSAHLLNELMIKLQEHYKDITYSPLTIDDVIPGNIYVSKHSDGRWYRTSVIKVINPGSISVFLCDYGYYNNLRLEQLVPLDVQFMDLPYQALKAKLYNVKPVNSKWTMDNCETFKKLVQDQQFFSILMGIEKDKLYEYDLVLILDLIDTSSEEDIFIKQVLVEKKIAVLG